MENKNSNSTLDEININPKTKIAKEKHNLIPINISLVKNIFSLPQQKDKNIIYINDIETLNDSSITNNLEQTSIRYNQNDSLSLSNSNNSSKTKSKNIRVKNINQNNYIKNELIAKEKENILLKKEIFKLREDINLLQNKFSKSKQNEQNLEKNITEIKKDFQIKENLFKKLIEKLKNELKEKDYILNSFQEKIILKNQTIERMRVQLKKKENEINELNRKLKKNLDMNYSILFKNNSKNKIKQKSRANSGRESMNKKLNISKINKSNSKEKIINNNIKTNNILQIQQYHLNTQRENMKNLNYIESSNSQKVIGLKKRSKLQSPILLETKYKKNNSKENKNKIRHHSYSDKVKENSKNLRDKKLSTDNNLKNLKHIFLLQEKNNEDVFLKRYSNSNSNKSKYFKQSIKSSYGDTTSSFLLPESENNRKNYKIDIPKLKKRKNNNSFNKLSDNYYSNYSNSNNQYLEQKIQIIKRRFNDEVAQNLRKINGRIIISNNLNKNTIFIPRHNTERKINFLYANSVNDSNSILSNNNYTVNTTKLYENPPSTKSNNISKQLYKY